MSCYNFRNAKRKGIQGISLSEKDKLVSAMVTDGTNELLFITKRGYALRYHEDLIRKTSRNSKGVRGILLRGEDEVVGVLALKKDVLVLLVSEKGYGKRLSYEEFQTHGRGTRGQIAYKITPKTGDLVGAIIVDKSSDLVCMTSSGKTIKIESHTISKQKRTAQGIRLVNLDESEKVVDIAPAEKENLIDEDE